MTQVRSSPQRWFKCAALRELLGKAVKGWMAAAEVAKHEAAMVSEEPVSHTDGEEMKSCDLM